MDVINDNGIVVAAIGVVGTLGGALFAHWDKIFGKKEIIKVAPTGYRPTNDFEKEVRTFLTLTGHRKRFLIGMEQVLNINKKVFLNSLPLEDEDRVEFIHQYELFSKTCLEEIAKSDLVAPILPVYEKNYTTKELQKLNHFYSTEVMQSMIGKQEALANIDPTEQLNFMKDVMLRVARAMKNEILEEQFIRLE